MVKSTNRFVAFERFEADKQSFVVYISFSHVKDPIGSAITRVNPNNYTTNTYFKTLREINKDIPVVHTHETLG